MERKEALIIIQNNGGFVVTSLTVFVVLIFWKLGLFFEISLSWSIFVIFLISVLDPLSTKRFFEKGGRESLDWVRKILETQGGKKGSFILFKRKFLVWTLVYLFVYYSVILLDNGFLFGYVLDKKTLRFYFLLFIISREALNTIWNSDFNPIFLKTSPKNQ